ncbi:hypothetical protein QUF50_04405 [Thiotrichales bacterium HSG1]|nr:hypothetical protein [Thiotrichales bacterium HSG1]
MITKEKQVDSCLEYICNQGCQAVTQIIQQLEQGQIIDIIEPLNPEQRTNLLQELKSIMAVYGGSCTDSPKIYSGKTFQVFKTLEGF